MIHHSFIGAECQEGGSDKEKAEDQQGCKRVNAYAGDGLQVVDEFHDNWF